MPYSYKLVPYKGLKIEADVDSLIKISDFPLARRVNISFSSSGIKGKKGNFVIDPDAQFLEDFFKYIPSMSMTFVDDQETLESASYKVNVPHDNKWDGKNVDFSNYKNAVEKNSDCFQIIYYAKNLHAQKVPYIRTFPNEDEAREHGIQGVFRKTDVHECEGTMFLKHSPNYRHFELKLYDRVHKEIEFGKLNHYSKARENSESESCEKKASKKGRDSFVLYVLDNYLTTDFFIDELPDDEQFLKEECFYEDAIPAEEREICKQQMIKEFNAADVEKT